MELVIINSLLFILFVLYFIYSKAYKQDNIYKEFIKQTLSKYITNEERIKEFVKLLEIGEKTKCNTKIKFYQISDKYIEEEMIELYFDYNFKEIDLEKFEYFVNVDSINNKFIQNKYNFLQSLVLQMEIKEEDLYKELYKEIGKEYYKAGRIPIIKELYNLKR